MVHLFDSQEDLFEAAEAGSVESFVTIARALEDRGALDPGQQTKEGWTLLQLAAMAGHSDIAAAALEFPSFQTTLNAAVPAVWIAASRGHLAVLRTLLSSGADPNVVSNGTSPLMEAAFRGFHLCVAELLDHGADPTMFDPRGRSAVHLCRIGFATLENLEKTPLLTTAPQTDLFTGTPTLAGLQNSPTFRHLIIPTFNEMRKKSRLEAVLEDDDDLVDFEKTVAILDGPRTRISSRQKLHGADLSLVTHRNPVVVIDDDIDDPTTAPPPGSSWWLSWLFSCTTAAGACASPSTNPRPTSSYP